MYKYLLLYENIYHRFKPFGHGASKSSLPSERAVTPSLERVLPFARQTPNIRFREQPSVAGTVVANQNLFLKLDQEHWFSKFIEKNYCLYSTIVIAVIIICTYKEYSRKTREERFSVSFYLSMMLYCDH